MASTAVLPAGLAAALSGSVPRLAHCTKARSRMPVRSRKLAVGSLMRLSKRLDLVSRRGADSRERTRKGSRQEFRIRRTRQAGGEMGPLSGVRWRHDYGQWRASRALEVLPNTASTAAYDEGGVA